MLSTKELVNGLLFLAESVASRRPLGERLTQLCQITTSLLACDRSSIFVARDGCYRAGWNFGNPPEIAKVFPKHRVRFDDPLIEAAVKERRHVVVNQALRSSLMNRETAEKAGIRAIVVAPMYRNDDEPLGFLTAEYNEHPGRFTETSSSLVSGVARLAQSAILSDEVAREVRQLAAQKARLELSKVESLGRLAGGVAHNFNNMLAVIVGYSELLKQRLQLQGDPLDEVDAILTASANASELVQQLLAVGRRQGGQPRRVSIDDLIRRCEPILRQLLPEDVALHLSLAAEHSVEVDPRQLEQVLVNLVMNARDAMPAGGRLDLKTREVQLGTSPSERDRTGDWVVVTVADTGQGMDEETREKVFDPFFTTKSPDRGAGLGLSTSLAIVEQSGGYVVVESELQRGTAVHVHLPRRDEAAAEPALPETAAQGKGETVLLVEDDAAVRRLLARVLRGQGYAVLEAADGREALAVAEAYGEIALLVTDVVMPGLGGRALADALRRDRPGLRVLFVSGYAEDTLAGRGVLAAGEAFLAKPIRSDDLARAVRSLLDRELQS